MPQYLCSSSIPIPIILIYIYIYIRMYCTLIYCSNILVSNMPKEHHKKSYVTFLETMIYHILFIYSVVDVTYLAKLVPVTPISLWFMVDLSYIYIYIYIWMVFMGFICQQTSLGGHQLVIPSFLGPPDPPSASTRRQVSAIIGALPETHILGTCWGLLMMRPDGRRESWGFWGWRRHSGRENHGVHHGFHDG